MTVATTPTTRWQRAEQIDPASIRPLGHDTYLVPSQSSSTGYTVLVTLDHAGNIAERSCTCPDFVHRRGADHLCKHIIAAANKVRQQQSTTTQEVPMSIAVVQDITFTVSPFPQPGTPVWDDEAYEWYMHDEDGQVYWGDTPSACMAAYHEQQRRTAEHARKSGFSILELREMWARDRDWAERQIDERPW